MRTSCERDRFRLADPQTGVAPRCFTRGRYVRSRCRCSMCSAIHTNSRSWLRSSSTCEPSDPPLKVVQKKGFGLMPTHTHTHTHRDGRQGQGQGKAGINQSKPIDWQAPGLKATTSHRGQPHRGQPHRGQPHRGRRRRCGGGGGGGGGRLPV